MLELDAFNYNASKNLKKDSEEGISIEIDRNWGMDIIILYNIVYVDVFMPFNFDFIFCVRYTLCFNSVLYTMLYLRGARGEQVIKFR